MSPLPLLLLLVPAISLSLGQDSRHSYNLYKDMQRGKVEDVERLSTEWDHQIDHSAHTWPSVGARVQVPNSSKRTINRFKNLNTAKEIEGEESEEGEETELHISEKDDEEVTATRFLIPRTHVLLRDGEGTVKLKRGAVFWRLRVDAPSHTANHGQISDIIWLIKAGKFQPSHSQEGLGNGPLQSVVRCRVLRQLYREFFHCN